MLSLDLVRCVFIISVVTCDPPDAIADSTYDPVLSQHDYNTTVNFTCNFGYFLFSGNNIQRCDENANWVNTKPVCNSECLKNVRFS